MHSPRHLYVHCSPSRPALSSGPWKRAHPAAAAGMQPPWRGREGLQRVSRSNETERQRGQMSGGWERLGHRSDGMGCEAGWRWEKEQRLRLSAEKVAGCTAQELRRSFQAGLGGPRDMGRRRESRCATGQSDTRRSAARVKLLHAPQVWQGIVHARWFGELHVVQWTQKPSTHYLYYLWLLILLLLLPFRL